MCANSVCPINVAVLQAAPTHYTQIMTTKHPYMDFVHLFLDRKTAPLERPKALKTFYHLFHYLPIKLGASR